MLREAADRGTHSHRAPEPREYLRSTLKSVNNTLEATETTARGSLSNLAATTCVNLERRDRLVYCCYRPRERGKRRLEVRYLECTKQPRRPPERHR